MTISTRATLRTALQNFFDDSTELTSGILDEHIDLGESEINRRLRIREQETSADVTISDTTAPSEASLPTGWIGQRRLYLNTDPIRRLTFVTPDDFWTRNAVNQTGNPEVYTIEGGSFVFAPTPTSTVTGKSLHWARANLNTSAHSLFINNPDLYLAAAAVWTAEYLENSAKQSKAQAKMDDIIDQLAISNERDRYGSVPVARSDVPSLDQ